MTWFLKTPNIFIKASASEPFTPNEQVQNEEYAEDRSRVPSLDPCKRKELMVQKGGQQRGFLPVLGEKKKRIPEDKGWRMQSLRSLVPFMSF